MYHHHSSLIVRFLFVRHSFLALNYCFLSFKAQNAYQGHNSISVLYRYLFVYKTDWILKGLKGKAAIGELMCVGGVDNSFDVGWAWSDGHFLSRVAL